MDKKKIGTLIKLKRMKAGITPDDLADKMGVSTSVIRKYETGEAMPSLYNFMAIRNIVDIRDYDLDNMDESIREMWSDMAPV